MKQIWVIMIVTSIGLLADFSRSGDVVTDSLTSLQWQDDAVSDAVEWQEAIDYCELLSLGGYDDWRLPNKKELLSIVDYSKYSPSIDSQFQNTTSSYYWSSTTYVYYTYRAWYVSFRNGYTDYYNKGNHRYVRCVRAGQ